MNALVPMQQTNAELYRASTDAADLCRQIVMSTAMEIQRRKYVKVEGWQAIAIAHGCTAGARDVERIDGGVRAIGEIRRMSDGALLAQAEGFVGEDEAVWFGGEAEGWEWGQKRGEKVKVIKHYPKRPDYAIRAMAQTRAISRACRSAFAHVVVMIDAGLSTTPAEEIPLGGFDDQPRGEPVNVTPPRQQTAPANGDDFPGDMGEPAPRKPTLQERANKMLSEARACRTTREWIVVANGPDAVALANDLDRSDPDLGGDVEQQMLAIRDGLDQRAAA